MTVYIGPYFNIKKVIQEQEEFYYVDDKNHETSYRYDPQTGIENKKIINTKQIYISPIYFNDNPFILGIKVDELHCPIDHNESIWICNGYNEYNYYMKGYEDVYDLSSMNINEKLYEFKDHYSSLIQYLNENNIEYKLCYGVVRY